MRTIYEARASTILFRLAAARPAEAGLYLLPANVCPVVPLALRAARRRFEFIDLDAESLHMSETLLRRRLAEGQAPPVAGLVYVRTYGAELDAGKLFRSLKKTQPELLVLDDRCLCRPLPSVAEWDPQGADVVLFSTGYSKQVDFDSGGFAHFCDQIPYLEIERRFDSEDLERMTALYKQHIRSRTPIYRGEEPGEKGATIDRLRWLETDPPAIEWGVYHDLVLKRREEAEVHRASLNTVYRELIPERVHLPESYHNWRFQIRVPRSGALLEKIFAAGFFASDHFYSAAELFGGHASPVATRLQSQIVNLFNDSRVSEEDAGKIGRVVARHLETNGDSEGARR